MRVERVAWIGTRTDKFDETTRFFRDVLGLAPVYLEDGFSIQALPSGDHDFVEVFGPGAGDRSFEAGSYTSGPVPAFHVSDIVAARAELAAAGVELLGEITWASSTPGYGWFHFRAPDGFVYGMMQGSRPPR